MAQGEFAACEQLSRDILEKLNRSRASYEASSGRVAAYHVGYLMQTRYQNLALATDYYRRCPLLSETEQTTGYYVYANAVLARLAAQQQDVAAACRYYVEVVNQADRHTPQYAEARAYLHRHASSKSLRQPIRLYISQFPHQLPNGLFPNFSPVLSVESQLRRHPRNEPYYLVCSPVPRCLANSCYGPGYD